MRCFRVAIVGVALASVLVVGLCGRSAEAARHNNNNNNNNNNNRQRQQQQQAEKQRLIASIRAQISAAQKALAEAKANQSASGAELDKVRQKLEEARKGIAEADSEQQLLKKELASLEEDILDDLPDNSEGAQVCEAHQKAKETVDAELKRVLESPAYVEKLKNLNESPDAGPLRAELRKAALDNDAAYQKALANYQEAKHKFDSLKEDLFAKNPQWKKANDALRESESAEKALRGQRAGGSVVASRELRTAKQVIAAAEATIREGNAKLKALGATADSKPKKK